MKSVSYEDLKKIINESLSEMVGEAGMPTPIGGAMPKPISGTMPKPISGTMPKPISGGMPTPIGGGMPTPIGGGNGMPNNPPLIQSNGTNDSVTFKGEKTKNGFRPGIYSAKYENFFETLDPNEQDQDVLKIDLDYIHNITVQRWISLLNKSFGSIIFADKVQKPWLLKKKKSTEEEDENKNFQYLVRIIIRPGKNNEFLNEADKIVDSLYTMPQPQNRMTKFTVSYDPSFKDELTTRIKDAVKKSVSKEEVEEVNMRIADTWMDLLSDMKNPAIQQKLGNISGFISSSISNLGRGKADVRGDNGFDAGHQLTFRNKMQVFAQDPMATFVAQEFMWNKWGHEVIDPNKYIIVTVPSKKKETKDDRDKGARAAGFAGGDDEFKLRKRRKEVEGGEVHAVKMHSQYASKDSVFFYPIKMYDVANTRVIPGRQSTFLDGPDQIKNLSNNLLGIPNTAAKAIQTPSSNAVAAAAPVTTNDNNNDQIELVKDSIIDYIKAKTPSTVPAETGNPEKDIVNYAYAYAKFLLATAFHNISKKETQEAFCQGFTAAVAIAVNIQDDDAARYLSQALANRGKDSTLRQLVVQWFNEYVDLLEAVHYDVHKKLSRKGTMKKVVEEDDDATMVQEPLIQPVSFEKFEELCGVADGGNAGYEVQDDAPVKSNIQESFFNFLDRMEYHGRI